jgi:hypothetical protein
VQLWICGIPASAILAMAVVGAAPDELETLLRAVPSPRSNHTWAYVLSPAETASEIHASPVGGGTLTWFPPLFFAT